MKSILNREFKYTPSVATDLAKTFERVRKEQTEAAIPRCECTKFCWNSQHPGYVNNGSPK